MTATAWNLKKLMQKLKEEFLYIILKIFFQQKFCLFAIEKRTL